VRFDAFGYLGGGLDIRRLHIDRADPQLLVAEKAVEVVGHIVFDQIRVALDAAYEIGLVAADIEVTMADLPIVIGANRIVALTNVHRKVNIVGKPVQCEIDRIHRSAHVVIGCRRKVGLVDLNMRAAGLGQTAEIVVQQLAEVEHHRGEIAS
jgi:hypothetical protein